MNKYLLIGISILVIIGAVYFFFGGIAGGVVGVKAEMIDEGDVVKIPLDGITGKAEFFNYQGIEFFVVRAKDGNVKTAFDACDVCYRSRKGYRQQGNDMICNNCGNYYPISGLGTKNLRGGGCWPGYLPVEVEEDFLVMKKTDLEAGMYRFA